MFFYEEELNNLDTTIRLSKNKRDRSTKDWKDSNNILAVAPIKEDISLDIAHQWSDMGDNPLSNMAKGIFKSLKTASPLLNDMSRESNRLSKEHDSGVFGGISKLTGLMGKYGGKALIMNNDDVQMFEGTTVSSQVTMETIFYHIHDFPVKAQLNRLLNGVVGSIDPIKEVAILNDLMSFQNPPNNYKVNFTKNKTGGGQVENAYTLFYGRLYTYTDMIMENVSITMSKNKVKLKGNTTSHVPLYAKISMTFKPARKFLQGDVDNILNLTTG